ncbi:hypothetical protein F2Q68_00023072 [Brassica cretica]|uniref:Uncharacterized protein n=1 Tax=Brassica cretica TaxID=69181 RepID=A0A8S9G531_BRACR|nr:hypothetical protein F2Q68_00023072 [Brassica cretica]
MFFCINHLCICSVFGSFGFAGHGRSGYEFFFEQSCRQEKQPGKVKENKKDAATRSSYEFFFEQSCHIRSGYEFFIEQSCRHDKQPDQGSERKQERCGHGRSGYEFFFEQSCRQDKQSGQISESNKKDAATEEAVMSSSSSNLVDRTSN